MSKSDYQNKTKQRCGFSSVLWDETKLVGGRLKQRKNGRNFRFNFRRAVDRKTNKSGRAVESGFAKIPFVTD